MLLTGILVHLKSCTSEQQILSLDVIHFNDDLQTIYKLVDTDIVEMPTRYINGKPYTFIVDEEGTYKPHKVITALCRGNREFLIGNILITGLADNEGNLTGLSLNDVINITNSVIKDSDDNIGYLIYTLRKGVKTW